MPCSRCLCPQRPIRESRLGRATFVGRTDEIIALRGALDAAEAGRGAVWLMGGESGVGKSRLVDELWIAALCIESALVLRGGAVAEGGAPYQMWIAPLRRLALAVAVDDADASALLTLIPDLPTLLDRPVVAAPPLDPAAAQARLFETIERLLTAWEGVLVLLLEDLHWAGDSLILLQRLAAQPLTRVLIVGTYRSEAAADLPDQMPGARALLLPRLDAAAVTQLAKAVLGAQGQHPDLTTWLYRETEGNALFIVEVMRALAEARGRIDDIPFQTLPDHIVTGGIRAVIQRRFDAIAPADRPLLHAAAAIGRALDLPLLRALVPQHLDDSVPLELFKLTAGAATVLSDFDGATHFYQRFIAAAERQGETAQRAEGLNGLARLTALRGDYPKARLYTEEAIAVTRALGNLSNLADHLNDLFVITYTLGDYAAAQIAAAECLAFYRQSNDTRQVPNGIVMLGILAAHESRYDEAIAHFTEALMLFRDLDLTQGVAVAQYYIGVSLNALGRYEEALAVLRAGMQDYLSLDSRYDAADTSVEIAEAHLAMGDSVSAFGALIDALRLCHDLDAEPVIVKTLLVLAAIRSYDGQHDKAARIVGLLSNKLSGIDALLVEKHHALTARLRAASGAAFAVEHDRGAALDFDAAVADLRALRLDTIAL
ncbi:MAG: AAA family ATPase [Chloroflexota bacterium]|nr:AAA family ATPase [Chloroflexota bacterium]